MPGLAVRKLAVGLLDRLLEQSFNLGVDALDVLCDAGRVEGGVVQLRVLRLQCLLSRLGIQHECQGSLEVDSLRKQERLQDVITHGHVLRRRAASGSISEAIARSQQARSPSTPSRLS